MGQMMASKTIDYHHLDMSRDDGMDEHGDDLVYGCHLAGFGLGSCQINCPGPDHKSDPA
jgi:hypothetical protein